MKNNSKFISIQLSPHSSFESQNFPNTSKKLVKNRIYFPQCTISHETLSLPQIHCPFIDCRISLFIFFVYLFSFFFSFFFFAFLKKAASASVQVYPNSLLEQQFCWYQVSSYYRHFVLTNYREIRFIGFLEGSLSIQKIEKFLSKNSERNF